MSNDTLCLAPEDLEWNKPLKAYKVGHHVELHPGCDLWMQGARFGVVSSISIKQGTVAIRLHNPNVRKLVHLPPNRIRHRYGW